MVGTFTAVKTLDGEFLESDSTVDTNSAIIYNPYRFIYLVLGVCFPILRKRPHWLAWHLIQCHYMLTNNIEI